VKIEGIGCDVLHEGSGFVFAPDRVLTNAHVVAGLTDPVVVAPNGTTLHATTVLFDPNLDIAVLHVPNLGVRPLVLDDQPMPRDTAGVVLGYPRGGPLVARPSVVLDDITAVGRNIYGTGNTTREVYVVEGALRPGNSGGPVVAADGTVLGVVFAKSATYTDIGFALTSADVRREALSAEGRTAPTSTGACSSG
jgi:S1-C subfamily serine protease